MQISSGIYKGLKLNTPSGESTRPTGIKVRQAVFNTLQARLERASFLDLFAGSGSMGIEALSKGASSATFVENDKEAYKCLMLNLKEVKRRSDAQHLTHPHVQAIEQDVARFLKNSQKSAQRFDIIWADPPYLDIPKIWASIFSEKLQELTKDNGLLIIESDEDGYRAISEAFDTFESFSLLKYSKYGYSHVSIWEKT